MMVVDETLGYVYVTGQIDGDFGTSQIATWQYDLAGNLQDGWPKVWPPSPEGQCYGVVATIFGSGTLYVVGAYTQEGFGTNTVVLQYGIDTIFGDYLIDAAEYDNSGECNPNFPVAAAFDGAGRIWVAGVSGGCMTGNDYLIWGLSTDDLDTQVVIPPVDHANLNDVPTDIVAGSSDLALGDTALVVVTGRSFDSTTGTDIQTVMYSVTMGDVVTDLTSILPNGGRFNNASNSFDAGTSVAMIQGTDAFVDIYVSGYTRPSVNDDYDYVVLGYTWDTAPEPDAFDDWTDVRDGTGGDDVTVKILCAADAGNSPRVVVTGTSWGGASNFDSWTLSYARNGAGLVRDWRSPFGGEDRAVDMVAVDVGDVYVIGRSFNGSNYDYRLARVSSVAETWELVWNQVVLYDVGSGHDYPAAVRVVTAFDEGVDVSDIYVTGRSLGPVDEATKYATLRYVQSLE